MPALLINRALYAYLFCIAGVLLPFSIAASNVLLGSLLGLAIMSGIWWKSAQELYHVAPKLITLWLTYMALMALGLLWSTDAVYGIKLISKQWSWLMIPVAFWVFSDHTWRTRMMIAISIGLSLHLLLAIAQSFGAPLPVTPPVGSAQDDPSGLIGRIGFGLLYGMWAAWLVHTGHLKHGAMRYALWALALLAVAMIFTVQGRSGYLITLILAGVVIWRLWLRQASLRLILSILVITSVLAVIAINGPAKERIQWTLDSINAFSQGDMKHAEARFSLWYSAWSGYKEHPWFGMGTGSFPIYAQQLSNNNSEINFDGKINAAPAHAHQMYLMSLTRWGPVGLLLLLLFFWQWIRTGWQADWRQADVSLLAFSGIALAVHGFSSTCLEEYYTSVYAGLYLAIGLAAISQQDNSHEHRTS